jgi:hypothetical protein
VTDEFDMWKDVPVVDLLERVDEFMDKVTVYQNNCKKLTKEFKEFAAYNDLKVLLET